MWRASCKLTNHNKLASSAARYQRKEAVPLPVLRSVAGVTKKNEHKKYISPNLVSVLSQTNRLKLQAVKGSGYLPQYSTTKAAYPSPGAGRGVVLRWPWHGQAGKGLSGAGGIRTPVLFNFPLLRNYTLMVVFYGHAPGDE